MSRCKSCGTEIQAFARFCFSCGAVLASGDIPTMVGGDVTSPSLDDSPVAAERAGAASAAPARAVPHSSHPGSSSTLLDAGRFLPGSLLAERYRVVALLGRGGMGEVYRADDLTLGQPVALKFLPEEAAKDSALLDRFRGEVRISRRVSHPNVCRVYDVGEVDGQTFFTMEYVDGEDLASLLRRIGRLPHDKALDIARQLCAGLAAAHAKGVLHRDLKPANIMLDGRGQAVITDFGLAALAHEAEGAEVRSGTPAYMAPEQLAGKEVTERSDIYSLGLVLYEIFTGKRAFSAENLGELLRSRSKGTVSRPSSLVKDMDPLVERVILQCLEAEAARRPGSALSVAAALPGGDPLAAALAAGETPSPQMVAAAGQIEGMKPRAALLCLAACVLGLLASVVMISSGNVFKNAPLDMPPEVLTEKAKEIIGQFGYNPRAVDTVAYFDGDEDYRRWLDQNEKGRPQWNKIFSERPPVLRFAVRQSPQYMEPVSTLRRQRTPGIVTLNDPPPTLSGMINLLLDTNGRLLFFQAIPPQVEENPEPAKPVDWKPLLAAAGLDPTQLQAATPQWNSLAANDERAAWTGKWPESGRPLRVEAAAWRGKPVFFQMIGPWTRPARMHAVESSAGEKASQIVGVILFLLGLSFACILARRHYKQGKADRMGAFRLAAFVFLTQISIWLCYGHFFPSFYVMNFFVLAVSTGLFAAFFAWVLYIALEPYVRKLWPQSIISWTRLLSGRIRDPLVGRDVLFGLILGLIWVVLIEGQFAVGTARFGTFPQMFSTDYLMGGRSTMGVWLEQAPNAITAALLFFFVLMGLRYLLRNRWAAALAFVLLFTALKVPGSSHPVLEAATFLMVYAVAAFSVVRFGLVSLATAVFVANIMLNVPLTLDFSRWYAIAALTTPLGFLAMAIWAFYTALGGQKLIKEEES
jgi:predicted Ser/Thr protein kinase